MFKFQDFQGLLQKFQDFPGLESKFQDFPGFQGPMRNLHQWWSHLSEKNIWYEQADREGLNVETGVFHLSKHITWWYKPSDGNMDTSNTVNGQKVYTMNQHYSKTTRKTVDDLEIIKFIKTKFKIFKRTINNKHNMEYNRMTNKANTLWKMDVQLNTHLL